MSRSEHRGGSWIAEGETIVASAQDRNQADRLAEDWGEDWCSLRGAQELKRRIERHWHAEGIDCRCEIVAGAFGVYTVRSNLALRMQHSPAAA